MQRGRVESVRVPILAAGELRRFLASRRGPVSLLAFALFWYAVLVWAVRPAGLFADGAGGGGAGALLDRMLGFDPLSSWAAPQLAAWWAVALYVLPAVAVFASADQIASDRARGTLRYLVMRASRTEILLGRFLGQALLMAGVVLVTAASVLVLVAIDRPDALGPATRSLPASVLALWLTLLPWIALMALVSALSATPGQATRYALILWVALSLLSGWLSRRFGERGWVEHLMPGSGVSAMLGRGAETALAPASIGLVHTAVFLGLAALVMTRRDL